MDWIVSHKICIDILTSKKVTLWYTYQIHIMYICVCVFKHIYTLCLTHYIHIYTHTYIIIMHAYIYTQYICMFALYMYVSGTYTHYICMYAFYIYVHIYSVSREECIVYVCLQTHIHIWCVSGTYITMWPLRFRHQ